MKEKIRSAIADMGKKLTRTKEHIYQNNETGEWLQGVSTVSSIVPKEWLASWGAKEAVKDLGYTDYDDYTVAQQVLELIKSSTLEDYIERLRKAKGAHARKSRKALIDGTAGHICLEQAVNRRINGYTGDIEPPPEPLTRPISQFLSWEKSNVKEWIASECMVIRPDKYYAGQLDAIAITKDESLSLIDFKFSSKISADYILQCSGYAACFEPYGIKFDKRIIIRLPKTLEQEAWNEKMHKYELRPNNIEVFEVPTPYESDRDTFFHALPLKQWVNMIVERGLA